VPFSGARPQQGPTPDDPHAAEAREQVSDLLPSGQGMAERDTPLTAGRVLLAWSPWVIMAGFLIVSGVIRQEEKNGPLDLGFAKSFYVVPVPALHNEVERAYEIQKLAPENAAEQGLEIREGPRGTRLREREAAEFKLACCGCRPPRSGR
jgi:hypothetical protein